MLISLHYSCKWMLKLRLSNLICLTTYLRILLLFDNVLLLTLSNHKSYQRLYSVNMTWKLFLKFLKSLSTHTTIKEKVGFAITFLCMHHATTDCVDSHILSVICKVLVKQALSLTHFLTITTSQTCLTFKASYIIG